MTHDVDFVLIAASLPTVTIEVLEAHGNFIVNGWIGFVCLSSFVSHCKPSQSTQLTGSGCTQTGSSL